jgi:hypothetical protein
MVRAKGFSLEVWLLPANNIQGGPARIVSYSLNPSYRNFTLGQDGSDLIMRLRTDNTNLNGTEPHLVVENVFSQPNPLHIVVSYNFKEQNAFVNGIIRKTSIIPGGNFKNWDPEYPLILGNEATGDRPWLGEISYVAIYNRALHAQEVSKSYNEVRRYISGDIEFAAPEEGQLVRYLFNEKVSDGISNSGTLFDSMNLAIPNFIQKENKPFLSFNLSQFPIWGSNSFYDILLNILLFIPLGFLLHAIINSYTDASRLTGLFVIIVGFIITLSAETLQYFIESRNSSSVDIIANWIGTLLGIKLKLMYNKCLVRFETSFCNINEDQITFGPK